MNWVNMESLFKLLCTLCLTIICYYRLKYTKGESGIGWFILGLILIW
jgi:hypothetical protein